VVRPNAAEEDDDGDDDERHRLRPRDAALTEDVWNAQHRVVVVADASGRNLKHVDSVSVAIIVRMKNDAVRVKAIVMVCQHLKNWSLSLGGGHLQLFVLQRAGSALS